MLRPRRTVQPRRAIFNSGRKSLSRGPYSAGGRRMTTSISGHRSPMLRTMAVLVVAVVKVFLYDASDLTGLYRVASFLGLGLTLIGIGYIYRHFVSEPAPLEE